MYSLLSIIAIIAMAIALLGKDELSDLGASGALKICSTTFPLDSPYTTVGIRCGDIDLRRYAPAAIGDHSREELFSVCYNEELGRFELDPISSEVQTDGGTSITPGTQCLNDGDEFIACGVRIRFIMGGC